MSNSKGAASPKAAVTLFPSKHSPAEFPLRWLTQTTSRSQHGSCSWGRMLRSYFAAFNGTFHNNLQICC